MQKDMKRETGLFLFVFISNVFFFFICPQSHISHYYVRSVFPHCNGSKLHKSPNPARPPHLAEICHIIINKIFKMIIDAVSAYGIPTKL